MMPSYRITTIIILLLGALVISFIPSGESLWIDEALTAHYARIDSFHNLVKELRTDTYSEALMPLFIFQTWLIGQLLGDSEWVLRAPNILWGIMAMIALYFGGRRLKIPWLPVLLIIHPFFWFYVNEARPYGMQICFASWLWLGLVHFHQGQGSGSLWAWIIGTSAFLLCAASMLGVVTVIFVFLTLAILSLIWHKLPDRNGLIVLGVWIAILAILGCYYAWALLQGTTGARLWTVGFQNIQFALFEFSGATGLSPPRAEIRELAKTGNLKELAFRTLPAILLFGSLLGSLILFWLTRWRRRRIDDLAFLSLAITAASFVSLLVLAFMAQWPFWGRHLAPSFPFFLCWLGLTLDELGRYSVRWHRVVFTCLLGALLTSSLCLRFSPKHARDDYRSAAQFARERIVNSEIVWWCASPYAAEYYGLPQGTGSTTHAILALRLHKQSVSKLPEPQWIILSKPDLYDPTGSIQDYIACHHYQVAKVYPSFRIYTRHAPDFLQTSP